MNRRDELRAADDWRDRIISNVGCEQATTPHRHGDRPPYPLGVMRLVVWTAAVIALAIVIAAALVTALAPAHAATEVHVVLHGLSVHGANIRNDGASYNERNPGAGLRLQTSERWAWQAGRYENSWSGPDTMRHSRYLLADFTPWRAAGGRVGGFLAVVDGYPWHDGAALLAPGLVARWQAQRVSLALRGGPTKHSRGMLALELAVRL